MVKYFFIIILFTGYCYPDTITVFKSIGDFIDASSVSVSRGEYIYAADAGDNKIYKFDIEGNVLANYGSTGLGKYELNQPVSIDASNGLDVYVADYINNRIIRLDYNLNFILLFDFNGYNPTADNSKKIYNPFSLTLLNTGELFILCDAGNYKAIGIREFNIISTFFGKVSDRIVNPFKITRGNSVDIWILEKSTNELMNFNNLGIFVKSIKLPDYIKPVSITYFENNLVILTGSEILFFELNKGKYSESYIIPRINNLRDISLLDKNTVLILSKTKVFVFKLSGQ